jgi:hypothetical protein
MVALLLQKSWLDHILVNLLLFVLLTDYYSQKGNGDSNTQR